DKGRREVTHSAVRRRLVISSDDHEPFLNREVEHDEQTEHEQREAERRLNEAAGQQRDTDQRARGPDKESQDVNYRQLRHPPSLRLCTLASATRRGSTLWLEAEELARIVLRDRLEAGGAERVLHLPPALCFEELRIQDNVEVGAEEHPRPHALFGE